MGQEPDNSHPLLHDLNEPQRQAVLHKDGPLLVIAGPGSGKTRVITRRAAMLVESGVSPWKILAITFTNKAADEMKKRIESLGVGRGMWVYTFHALGVRLIREFGPLASVQPGFTIYDASDQMKVIKDAMTTCGISDRLLKPEIAQSLISDAKNKLDLPPEYALKADSQNEKYAARIYVAYEELMQQRNALDFDDLLLRVALVLRDNDEIAAKLNERFRYLLIDEYQDTNYAQYLIAQRLSHLHRNICATGDPDQSIYAWRGADIRNILDFEEDYPDATVVRLEQNYRSHGNILRVASGVIAANKRRKHKDIWSELDEGDPVRVWDFDHGTRESEAIAADIAKRAADGAPWSDFAIFYRVNALSRALEESLRARGIPYRIARGLEFYNRREIRDVLAYLRVLVNPADEVSLTRIINTPIRGIGDTTIERLIEIARTERCRLFDVIHKATAYPQLKSAAAKVKKFADLLDSLKLLTSGSVAGAVSHVLTHSKLEASLREEAEVDGDDRLANVQELVTAAARYEIENEEPTLADFLTRVALTSDQDLVDPEAGVVMLMTLHAAKGLEFPSVYLCGLEQGMLPHERAIREGDIEEERRLLFVGITRAMQRLTISLADERLIRGQSTPRSASQFLQEFPEDAIALQRFSEPKLRSERQAAGFDPDAEWRPGAGGRTARPGFSPTKLPRGRWGGGGSEFVDERTFTMDDHAGRGPTYVAPTSPYADWKPQTFVQHPAYGVGQIVTISGTTPQTRAVIRFPGQGDKTFVLEHAPMIQKLERPAR
ncbi:MAG: ATP-dependent helicase [Phycisphaerae bacterium]